MIKIIIKSMILAVAFSKTFCMEKFEGYSYKKNNFEISNILEQAKKNEHIRCVIDINQPIDEDMNTYLHKSIKNRNIENVKILLMLLKADPNKQNKKGKTPLHIAIKEYPDVIKLLINHKSDPKIKDKDNISPLHLAVLSNSNYIEFLINNGADINAEDESGETPLHYAVTEDKLKETIILLKFGANPNKANSFGETPYNIAREKKFEFTKVFFDNAKNQNELISGYAEYSQMTLEKLIKLGLSLYDENLGYKALEFAILNNQLKAINLLKKTVNLDNSDKNSLLYLALKNKKFLSAKEILENDTNIEILDKNGLGLMHKCALENNIEGISFLIKNGSSINITDCNSKTALHIAAARNYIDLTSFLLNNNADVEVIDSDGKTPSCFAHIYNNYEIIILLLSKKANFKVVEDIEIKGYTELHYSAQYDSEKLLSLLNSKNVNLTAKDLNEKTALHYAAQYNYKSLQLLLKTNINIEELDKNGNTALDIALAYNEECAKLLIIYGAKPKYVPSEELENFEKFYIYSKNNNQEPQVNSRDNQSDTILKNRIKNKLDQLKLKSKSYSSIGKETIAQSEEKEVKEKQETDLVQKETKAPYANSKNVWQYRPTKSSPQIHLGSRSNEKK